MKKVYKTRGTCSNMIEYEVEDGIVRQVKFSGGCDGNLKAISRLVEGMKTDDVINTLEGIDCGHKGTSCGDQLAKALRQAGNS